MELLQLAIIVITGSILCTTTVQLSSSPSSSESDANALLTLKGRVERDPQGVLQGWLRGNDPCSWYGITCSDEGRVTKLDLSNAGLTGALYVDELIIALDQLHVLLLQGNAFYLTGWPPSSSSCSSTLQTVDLSSNSLTASLLPDFLASCNRLTSLNLSHNSLSGISSLLLGPSLLSLDLSHNQLSGSAMLKDTFSNCRNLTFLGLSANKFTGGLAGSTLSGCVNLKNLNLSFNLLSDVLPPNFLSVDTASSLQVLDLSHNNLSGDLASFSLGAGCGNITFLDLSFNPHLTGSLPTALQNCRFLQSLILSGNSLGPQLPPFLGSLPALETLNLARNRFAGEIPPELCLLCRSLQTLDLSYNAFVGEIPSTFTSCSSLESINLGSNQLTSLGAVLKGIGGSLKYLSLPFNNLTATLLPLSELSNYRVLQVL